MDDLVDDLFSVLVLLDEYLAPKLFILPLHKVPGLQPVKVVLVGDGKELLVALTPSSLVGSESQVRVSLLTVFSDDLRIVVLIVDEEIFWVLVDVNVDLGEGIVKSWLLDTLVSPGLEPRLKHSELSSLLKLINKVWNWADSDRVEQLLDVELITVKLEKGAEHLWGGVLVNFK